MSDACNHEPKSKDELVALVNKAKVNEVEDILRNYFEADRSTFSKLCPIFVIMGPVGCGKTTTIKVLARELNAQFKEYRDDLDCRSVWTSNSNDFEAINLSVQWRQVKRYFDKFEKFVLTTAMFPDLSLGPKENKDRAIVHVESPSWACQPDMFKKPLKTLIRKLHHRFATISRRILIVLEFFTSVADVQFVAKNLLKERHITFTEFSKVSKTGMRNLIIKVLGNILTKEQQDRIVESSMGDMRSCINTLRAQFNSLKEQDLHHSSKNKKVKLDFSMVFSRRGENELADDLFHFIGKVMYNKRIVSKSDINNESSYSSNNKNVHEPHYPLKNDPEDLVENMGITPVKLMSWLHSNYDSFCGVTDVTKAGEFLDHLADADCVSLDSCQSTQFYDKALENACDSLRALISVRGTYLSLYQDIPKKLISHKFSKNKNSVEISFVDPSNRPKDSLYRFRKPQDWMMYQVLVANKNIADVFCERLGTVDRKRVCLEYLPFYFSRDMINISDNTDLSKSLYGIKIEDEHRNSSFVLRNPISPEQYGEVCLQLGNLMKTFSIDFDEEPIHDDFSDAENMDCSE